MLRWQEEGEDVLITDPKEPIWVKTPLSGPERSLVKRSGKFKLLEDGTLEGDVTVEYTGHFAIERKEENDDDSQAQREESLKDELKARMSTAELSEIRIENVNDPTKPFLYAYHIRVPGYAQRTGKRLFVQPGVFQKGLSPVFSAGERKYPIYFHYPWSEADDVTIDLPEGYSLDSPDAPAGFKSGQISEYEPQLSQTSDGRALVYKRKFFFGGGGNILFPAASYSQLKYFFTELQKQDSHMLSLKSQ
jgi:hypothetical protein